MNKLLIYGIGNPYRCDDAVGIKAAEELARVVKNPDIDIKSGSIDGTAILDEIVGYDWVIFIDSVKTKNGKPGNIYKIDPTSFESSHSFSSHGINFVTALQFGKKFDLKMPERTDIYAVEIEDSASFGEECTQRVRESIPKVVEVIIKEINRVVEGTEERGK